MGVLMKKSLVLSALLSGSAIVLSIAGCGKVTTDMASYEALKSMPKWAINVKENGGAIVGVAGASVHDGQVNFASGISINALCSS